MRPEARPLWIVSESKLQQAHPRKAKLLAKTLHLGSNHAQVLGNKWQFFQFILQGQEEFGAGTLYPLASSRRQGAGRDLPVSLEAAEMIQSHEVEQPG